MRHAPTTRPDHARERDGALLCVVAALGFAGSVVMGKLAYAAGADLMTLLVVRFAIAAVVLWALAARRAVLAGTTARDAWPALALGMLPFAAVTGLTFAALTRLDASLTELLLFSYPALVVLIAFALGRERATRRTVAALGFASGGVVLVLAGSATGSLDPLGTTFALAGAVLYAAYVLIAAALDGRLHPLAFAALVCTGAAISFATAAAASGSLRFDMGVEAWGWSVAIALGSTVVAVSASLAGIARLGPARASILATFEPLFACLLAFLTFDERLSPLQLAGGACILLGALVLQVRRRQTAPAGTRASASKPAAIPAASRSI